MNTIYPHYKIASSVVISELDYITNQIFKLLPLREEKKDWKKTLKAVIEELTGMNILLMGMQDELFPLLCKLEGLIILDKDEDYFLFRKTVFDALSLLGVMIEKCRAMKA